LTFSTDEPVGRFSAALRKARAFITATDTAAVARRAGATALVIRLASAGLAYVAQVVFARLMGQYEYGVFAYTWVWFLVFAAVATLGFGDSPVRYVAQLRERGEFAHLRGFIRFAPMVIAASSIVFGALLIAALPFAEGILEHAYLMPMALMAVSIPFACLQSFLEGLGRSYNWTIPALLPVYILRQGLLLVIMVAAVALGFEPTALTGFGCLILTMVLSTAYQATAIRIRVHRVVERGPRAYRPREWMRGSAPFAVLYGAQHLSSFADVLVLSFFVSPAKIAIYFAATRIIQVVNLIPYAATVGTAHLFSAAHTRGDHDELQRLCRYVAATTLLIAAIALTIIVTAGQMMLDMFGHGFAMGYVPLVILAAGVLARVAAGPAEDMLNMTGHGDISASTYLVIVVVNVVLAAVMIVPFGLNGAAIASSISLALRALWLSFAVWRRLHVHTSILTILLVGGLAGIHARAEHLRAPAE
jgi:O-antigen/teichoic acid export membrane protein